LPANIGFRSVFHSSLIDMMKDDSVYVSKNVYFRNNLAMEMERNEANNHLKAYCQANKILSDQIRELKEHVEAKKRHYRQMLLKAQMKVK
jgi:hypothetical protein